jgi:hypothetical protein
LSFDNAALRPELGSIAPRAAGGDGAAQSQNVDGEIETVRLVWALGLRRSRSGVPCARAFIET